MRSGPLTKMNSKSTPLSQPVASKMVRWRSLLDARPCSIRQRRRGEVRGWSPWPLREAASRFECASLSISTKCSEIARAVGWSVRSAGETLVPVELLSLLAISVAERESMPASERTVLPSIVPPPVKSRATDSTRVSRLEALTAVSVTVPGRAGEGEVSVDHVKRCRLNFTSGPVGLELLPMPLLLSTMCTMVPLKPKDDTPPDPAPVSATPVGSAHTTPRREAPT